MLDLSTTLWISFKPLVKILLPSFVGATLVRTGKMGQEGIRTAAQIQIYGALPCLLFSNIVPSITANDWRSIAICLGMSVFYMVVPGLAALFLRWAFWVPEHFRWGFLVAAVWSNWGNVPLGVIQSVLSSEPFGKPGDVDLGIAYASFFILVNNSTMFAGPGIWMIKRDFRPKPPTLSSSPVRSLLHLRGSRRVSYSPIARSESYEGSLGGVQSSPSLSVYRSRHSRDFSADSEMSLLRAPSPPAPNRGAQHRFPLVDAPGKGPDVLEQSDDEAEGTTRDAALERARAGPSLAPPAGPPLAPQACDRHPGLRRVAGSAPRFLRAFMTPCTMALLLGLVVAVVPALKALFVPDPIRRPAAPSAPDGEPLLAVVLDATAYLGAAAVPIALLVLGASFAQMSFPRPLSRLPLPAIASLAAFKLIVLPILGCGVVLGLQRLGLAAGDGQGDRVLRFLLVYYGNGVTATNQIALSALAITGAEEKGKEAAEGLEDGKATLDLLCAFIMVQYIMLPFTGTAVIAVALQIVDLTA